MYILPILIKSKQQNNSISKCYYNTQTEIRHCFFGDGKCFQKTAERKSFGGSREVICELARTVDKTQIPIHGYTAILMNLDAGQKW